MSKSSILFAATMAGSLCLAAAAQAGPLGGSVGGSLGGGASGLSVNAGAASDPVGVTNGVRDDAGTTARDARSAASDTAAATGRTVRHATGAVNPPSADVSGSAAVNANTGGTGASGSIWTGSTAVNPRQ